jgi:hypothetical protein
MIENDNEDDDDYNIAHDEDLEEEEEENREIQEDEKHQLRIEFATNIIAAYKYCLRNVIHTGKGFDCEILYLPRHKSPSDDSDTFFSRIFKVRVLDSGDSRIDCKEIRSRWGGTGELNLGPVYISDEKAVQLTKQALSIAATLLKIPENEDEQERFFADIVTTEAEEEEIEGDGEDNYYDNNNNNEADEVVRQQEHEHELDIVIAELCSDVEIAFFEPRLWGW